MNNNLKRFLSACVLIALAAVSVRAQGAPPQSSPNDSLFRRARKLVAEGNGAAGRALVDSVLRRSEEGTPAYGDALYWQGALAETAAEAERTYRRVIVEYPLGAYVDDALLAIAELEQARGDRAAALAHLQRFVREHPADSPARGVAALAAARLAFEERDNRTACGLIGDARTSTPASNVEMRNQIDYYGNRCSPEMIAAAPAPSPATTAAPVTPAPVVARRDSSVSTTASPPPKKPAAAPSPSAPAPAIPVGVSQSPPATPTRGAPPPKETPATGNYTIQVAAYNTKAEADQLVAKLAKRDVKARVSGTEKPFRVRLDFYPTRQAAQAEVVSLKGRGIIGFVTTEAPGATKP